MQVNTYNWEIC